MVQPQIGPQVYNRLNAKPVHYRINKQSVAIHTHTKEKVNNKFKRKSSNVTTGTSTYSRHILQFIQLQDY